MATLAIGLLNYGYSLLLTRLLDPGPFSVFAAGQALLLTAGTVATSAVPWVLAQRLAETREDRDGRRAAVWFAVTLNASIGALAALLCAAISLSFGSARLAAVVAVSAFLIFLATTVNGWFQGDQRFGALGAIRVTEVVVKVLAGGGLAWYGATAAGGVAAFAVGSAAVLVVGTVVMRRDIRPSRSSLTTRVLWASTGGVVAIQGAHAVLISADVVLAAVLPLADVDAGSYQAAGILAKIPVFLAGAVAVVVFPSFSTATDAERPHLLDEALASYLRLAFPVLAVLLTIPGTVLALIFPAEYSSVGRILPFLAVAGTAVGVATVATTCFQAARRYRESVHRQWLGVGVTVAVVLLGWVFAGAVGMAAGAAAGTSASAALLVSRSAVRWPGSLHPRRWPLVTSGLLLVSLLVASVEPFVWTVLATLAAAVVGWQFLRGPRTPPSGGGDDRPRILHLGFEDPRRPGSGGGSYRTHEVNRRLSSEFQVTVLTSSWPGARDRDEDGVRYLHVGIPGGYVLSILSYFAALPIVARRHAADLVVEDYGAPFSSSLAPAWSHRPTISVVQWLNAREKSRQYHLPFFLVETLGLRLQSRYIAVSEDLAQSIRSRSSGASVAVVPNGVEPEALEVPLTAGLDVVFLGRLERAQKGIDLLLQAFDAARDRIRGRLIVVGDGPDRVWFEHEVARRGLGDRVTMLGRLAGRDKFEALAAAGVVAMPSRFETFGIVAVEALACGTPVVAFDIPCLRAVVPREAGALVPAFDVRAFSDEIARLLADPAALADHGARGREFASRFDWDDIARIQGGLYREAIAGARARR